jgi:hypothetical protein
MDSEFLEDEKLLQELLVNILSFRLKLFDVCIARLAF